MGKLDTSVFREKFHFHFLNNAFFFFLSLLNVLQCYFCLCSGFFHAKHVGILVPPPGIKGLPGSSVIKNPPAVQEIQETGSGPGSGRSPGEGNGNLFQYSCLGNPMNREAWWAAVHGVTRM